MNTYKSARKRPIITTLCFIAIIILGIVSCKKSPNTPIPDIKTIMVVTRYPGASASEIENNVTRPLENILYSVGHLKHISSKSCENISIITLEFEPGYDIDNLTNDVRDKIDMAMRMTILPNNAGTPFIVKPSDTIIILSVKAEESLPALYKILDDNIASPLARIDGVGTVSIIGAPKREINVYMDPYKMEAYNITIESVSAIIAAENRNIPCGNFDIGNNTYALRVEGEFKTPKEMLDIIVGSYNGANIYLKDVASLVDGFDERAPKTFIDGQQGAMIIIELQSGGNSTHITNAIKEMLPELQKRLPSDIETSFFASLLTSPSIKSKLLPTPCVRATLELPIGTRVEIAEEIGMRLTSLWKERYGNAMTSYIFSVGLADEENTFTPLSSNASHIINFYLKFTPETERSKSLAVICDEMRADIRMYPEIARSKVSMGGESKASFEIYGYDFAITDCLAKELSRELSKSEFISQVNISRSDYQPQYTVDFDREKLAMHGLNLSTAASYMRNRYNGALATYYREDGDEYDVKVRYEPNARQSINDIENIVIYGSNGQPVRIKELGKVVLNEMPPTIERKDRERIVTVDAVMAAGATPNSSAVFVR